MQAVAALIQNLRNAPDILENLLREIPARLLKAERKAGKWTIHSHACHLTVAQPIMLARLRAFLEEERPEFKPYFPDQAAGEEDLLNRDLGKELGLFREHRERFLHELPAPGAAFWAKEAGHPEYDRYNPYIMVRHLMMHDYLHMYRIEELWITRDAYL